MRQGGGRRRADGAGPWLNLFVGAAIAVVAVIAALSYGPGPALHRSQIDLSAPQVLAPEAPSPMR